MVSKAAVFAYSDCGVCVCCSIAASHRQRHNNEQNVEQIFMSVHCGETMDVIWQRRQFVLNMEKCEAIRSEENAVDGHMSIHREHVCNSSAVNNSCQG